MPPLRGLFHRAIAQSGVDAVGLLPEAAAATRDRVLQALEIRPDRLDKLLEVPVGELLSATERACNSTYPGAGFFPVVDGTNLPAHPVEAIAAGSARDVPLIIGTMRDETAINTFYDPATGRTDHRGEWEAVPPMLGDRADEVIEVYRRGRPSADETELYIAITSDRLRVPAIRIAEAKLAGGGAPVYMYLGAYRHPYMGGAFGAVHGTDQPLVFENLHLVPSLAQDPQAWELSAKVAGAWSAFAASGDPSIPDMPAWPAYSLEQRSTMVLDVESRIEEDPNADERRAWEGMDLRGTGLVSRTPSRR
jgi:para-nitrobenzyl esterase